jgi:hypothetical protein
LNKEKAAYTTKNYLKTRQDNCNWPDIYVLLKKQGSRKAEQQKNNTHLGIHLAD